jgi:SAM-dependent methyltransferase
MAPQDRELVESWANEISGPVIDAGCGPGHWTAFLHERGVAACGVDLAPEFVTVARQRFPQITFRTGDLGDLGVEDGSLGAILSWYSVIHTDPADVPAQLTEFARCIRPGGSLLIGFFDGDALAPFDHAVVTAYYWPVDAMHLELKRAGFELVRTHTRTDPGHRPYAAVVAKRLGA